MIRVFLLFMIGWQTPQTSTVQVPDMLTCQRMADAINAVNEPNVRASCMASTAVN
jgi:hypothetical protein